jgi:hypothetical protein
MFENTYLITDKLTTFSEADVEAAEVQLGTRFPEGYREYMTRLGVGEYCGYINVYPPQMIARDQVGAKPPLEEFCHSWNGQEFGLSAERIADSIPIANSTDGHWVIFEVGIPDAIYVLPRDEQVVVKAGTTLMDALTWLYEPEGSPRFRYFNSEIDQQHVPIPRNLALSYEDLRDWLLGLNRHDHVEETSKLNEASGNMTYALSVGGKVQIAQPGDEKHLMAFFKCFSGYVMCYTDLFQRLNIQIAHDPTTNDGTLQLISEFLQSKSA